MLKSQNMYKSIAPLVQTTNTKVQYYRHSQNNKTFTYIPEIHWTARHIFLKIHVLRTLLTKKPGHKKGYFIKKIKMIPSSAT